MSDPHEGVDADIATSPDNRLAGRLTALPTPGRRRIPLETLEQVRHEMARVYRAMRHYEIPPQDGTRLVYVLSAIGKALEGQELERRVSELEATSAPRITR
jgi:hypothetical protein